VPSDGVLSGSFFMDGDTACAEGAICAGCRFFGGYPITPATEIAERMARRLPQVGGVYIQMEDEIASMNAVLGASWAGRRAMTATSGPGLALMIEALGLASMTEIPIVVVDVQRAGPSTGMPTKTSQGDLYMAMYAGNDDAPRFVVAPSSVEDCFYQMVNAFNLAERYQMPVIVLSDQSLAPRVETCRPFQLDQIEVFDREIADLGAGDTYQRYKITETGVSPMTIPGMKGGHYTAEGLEHNEKGNPNYTPDMHQAMMDKRRRKVDTARQQLTLWPDVVEEWGDDDAAIAVMGWGSSLGPVKEAMARAQAAGYKVAALFPKVLFPMPDFHIRRFMKGRRAIIIPELNQLGQFAQIIEHRYTQELIRDGIEVISLTKYRGLPFKPVEVFEKIVDVAQSLTVRARD